MYAMSIEHRLVLTLTNGKFIQRKLRDKGCAGFIHKVVSTPYSRVLAVPEPPTSRTMLQLPSPGPHLVLMARMLLVLSTFLQAVPPSQPSSQPSAKSLRSSARKRDMIFPTACSSPSTVSTSS